MFETEIRLPGISGAKIYHWFQQGIGTQETLLPKEDAWSDLSRSYVAIHQEITRLIALAEQSWRGQAAERAKERFQAFAEFAKLTHEASGQMATQVANHVNEWAWIKQHLHPMDSDSIKDNFFNQAMPFTTGLDKKIERFRKDSDHNRELFDEYGTRTSTDYSTAPTPPAPPTFTFDAKQKGFSSESSGSFAGISGASPAMALVGTKQLQPFPNSFTSERPFAGDVHSHPSSTVESGASTVSAFPHSVSDSDFSTESVRPTSVGSALSPLGSGHHGVEYHHKPGSASENRFGAGASGPYPPANRLSGHSGTAAMMGSPMFPGAVNKPEEHEHQRPHWLMETEDVWSCNLPASPAVIGE